MERALGLYLSISSDGKIKRNLTARNGEAKIKATTVADEIISFSELNFRPYAQVVDVLRNMFADAHIEDTSEEHFGEDGIDTVSFAAAMQTVYDLLDTLEEEDILHGTLTRLMLEDAVPPNDGSAWWMIQTGHTIIEHLSAIMDLQFLINQAVYDIRCGNTVNYENKYAFFAEADFTQIYSLGKKLTTQYRFRSIIEYYRFLMIQFLASLPNVALCECCGRYFIPKTRKKTLYCDRVIKAGKTCKELAPALKHKLHAENDDVVQTFDRARQKMYRRYERAKDSLHKLPKGITYDEFYVWLDNATAARDAYLNDKLSAEEALKIIDG